MDTTYRLTQKGSEVQGLLNQVTPNTQNIQQLQQDVTTFLNTQQVQALINASLHSYSTTQEVAAAISSALSTALASYSTTVQMTAAIEAAITAALTSYSTTAEVTAAINGAITTAIASYYTKLEIDTKLAQKQDALQFDQTPTLNSVNPVTSNGVKVALDGEATARGNADTILQGLITNIQNALVNYYLKTETYSQSQVDALVAAVGKFQSKIVQTLPEPSLDTTGWIYLVPSDNPKTQNVKEEYITVLDGSTYKWEHIGSTNIDLSGYSTTEQMNAAIASALSAYSTTQQMNTAISNAIANYYTKSETDTQMAGKQDTISDLQTIRNGAAAGATAVQPSALGDYYTKTQVDELDTLIRNRVLYMEQCFGKYDTKREITLSQAKSGKYVDVSGQEATATGYGISNAIEVLAGDILLIPSAQAVPADVSVVARIVTRTYQKVIGYTYTYQQANPELYDTATADYDQTLVYTAVYDTSGETPQLTGWTRGGQTYQTLPATHEVTESYYEPLIKQSAAAMPSTGYYVYLCPQAMTVVISGLTATVDGGVCLAVGWGIFKNIVSNFLSMPGQNTVAQAFAQMQAEIDGLRAQLENLGETRAVCIDSENLPKVCGQPLVVEGAGAPSVVPMFVGQRYHDTTNSKCYEAFAVTNSTSNWKLLN